MATLRQQRIDTVRAILVKRYPGYWGFSNGERFILAMSVLCNDIKVKEIGGNNKGPWIKEALEFTGNAEGAAWCAAMVNLALEIAKVFIGPANSASAAVINWKNWAKANGRLSTKPGRGKLCLWIGPNGVNGHIGGLVSYTATRDVSYEGNTSSGMAGSQRDGQGMFKRERARGVWQWYIDLEAR